MGACSAKKNRAFHAAACSCGSKEEMKCLAVNKQNKQQRPLQILILFVFFAFFTANMQLARFLVTTLLICIPWWWRLKVWSKAISPTACMSSFFTNQSSRMRCSDSWMRFAFASHLRKIPSSPPWEDEMQRFVLGCAPLFLVRLYQRSINGRHFLKGPHSHLIFIPLVPEFYATHESLES